MNFTFEEWDMIRQAVRNWAEKCEELAKESKPSDDRLSCYQIFTQQAKELRRIESKINNSVI